MAANVSPKADLHHSKTFTSSFWSPDYLHGLSVLFDKLEQGVAENAQVINFITARISLESAYAANLQTAALDNATSRTATSGFNRDEGASLKQGFESFLEESKNQGIQHAHIAANLERLVRGPFSHYAASHKTRILSARSTVTTFAKDYLRATANVNKSQQSYFAKARQLEDNSDPSITKSPTSSPLRNSLTASSLEQPPAEPQAKTNPPQDLTIELAGILYTPATLAPLLSSMLYSVPQETMRLSILGSYDNVSVGEDIVLWVRKYLSLKSLGEAEKFGQGLIDHGYLRLVGAVGNRFSGSTHSKYQWQPKAIDNSPESVASEMQAANAPTSANAPRSFKLTRVSGYISGFLPAAVTDEGKEQEVKTTGGRESQIIKLQREISDSDKLYKDQVYALDLQRCKLEQSISETLTFMQQCERDRVKAVKTVLRDFSASIGKTLDNMSESVSRMALYEQFVDPLKDLDYLIERYKTGTYAPKPVVYDNFFNSTKIQSFGVDLKYSSHVVSSCIEYLTSPMALNTEDDKSSQDNTLRGDEDDEVSDNHSEKSTFSDSSEKTAVFPSDSNSEFKLNVKYQGLSENSKVILSSLWAGQQSQLSEIQTLRNQINTGKEFDPYFVFSGLPLQVVISCLKEFLLELPDSIVTSTVYDIIKTTYTKTSDSPLTTAQANGGPSEIAQPLQRVDRLVGLITHLPRVNLTCLQILVTHFAEICGLPESGEPEEEISAEVQHLARILAPFILRPRTTTALTMTDKHPVLFLQDLIVHRVHIFGGLQTRLNQRSRSASTTKANRRSQIEARNKLISSLSQASALSTAVSALKEGNTGGINGQYALPRSPSPVVTSAVMSSGKMLPLTLSPASRQFDIKRT